MLPASWAPLSVESAHLTSTMLDERSVFLLDPEVFLRIGQTIVIKIAALYMVPSW